MLCCTVMRKGRLLAEWPGVCADAQKYINNYQDRPHAYRTRLLFVTTVYKSEKSFHAH
jgi:hypothetical protein